MGKPGKRQKVLGAILILLVVCVAMALGLPAAVAALALSLLFMIFVVSEIPPFIIDKRAYRFRVATIIGVAAIAMFGVYVSRNYLEFARFMDAGGPPSIVSLGTLACVALATMSSMLADLLSSKS
jgi:hypothetical protein